MSGGLPLSLLDARVLGRTSFVGPLRPLLALALGVLLPHSGASVRLRLGGAPLRPSDKNGFRLLLGRRRDE